MIIQKVEHKLQIIKKLAEAQRECFEQEMEIVKEQLQEIEAKSLKLEK